MMIHDDLEWISVSSASILVLSFLMSGCDISVCPVAIRQYSNNASPKYHYCTLNRRTSQTS